MRGATRPLHHSEFCAVLVVRNNGLGKERADFLCQCDSGMLLHVPRIKHFEATAVYCVTFYKTNEKCSKLWTQWSTLETSYCSYIDQNKVALELKLICL